MDHSINIYKDVISQELCDELIALHTTEKHIVEKEIIENNQNVQCYYLDLNDYPEQDEKVFDVVDKIIDRVQEDHEWFPDNLTYGTYVVRKHYGKTLLHVDGLYDYDGDTKPGNRVLSIIIALTDDYDGGVFNFPKQNYQVKLKKREAITFPPNYFYPHEVSAAKNGDRYTLILWVLVDPPEELKD